MRFAPVLRSITIRHLDDFTLTLGKQEFIPIILGGMGVDASTPKLALEIARLGGIGHISDAMLLSVVDRHFGTHYVRDRQLQYADRVGLPDKSAMGFDPEALRMATDQYVRSTMSAKRGDGAIFLNVMEKLQMGNPREMLQIRLTAAMDAGIDGITLSAGLHLGSLELMHDNPRFRDVKIGVIVSSARALKIFLHRAAKLERMPDYITVEGPLAGGHLGFPLEWQDYDLNEILADVQRMLTQEGLAIPVIAAGGVFTGSDAVNLLKAGVSGVQVATRFAVTRECGLPDPVKQAFFAAEPEDVVVNMISPTGYPMRMLRQSPAIGARIQPMCESFGYGLDTKGHCSYNEEYHQSELTPEKTCLCAMMLGFKTWTIGHTAPRLKETSLRLPDGTYQLLTAEQVFRDYQHSTDQRIALPPCEEAELLNAAL